MNYSWGELFCCTPSLCGVRGDSAGVHQHLQRGVWWTGDQKRWLIPALPPAPPACGPLLKDKVYSRAGREGCQWKGGQRSRRGRCYPEDVCSQVCWDLWRRRAKTSPKDCGKRSVTNFETPLELFSVKVSLVCFFFFVVLHWKRLVPSDLRVIRQSSRLPACWQLLPGSRQGSRSNGRWPFSSGERKGSLGKEI